MFTVKSPTIKILFFLISIASYSQSNLYTALTIPKELKENANAVVRDYSMEINIEDVDKMIVTERKVVTVLNKIGNEDATISEGYDNHSKITSLSATIYDAFGLEIKKYKERDFLDVSAVDGVSLYTDSRVKYVDYKPISYPYTLVYEATYKTSTTGFIPSWFPVNGYFVAVEKSTYKVNNEKQIPWRKKEENLSGFTIENNSTEHQVSYVLKNQKAFDYENSAPAGRDFLPHVKVALNQFNLDGVNGAFTNWEEFGKWMHSELIQGRDVVDESTKNKVLALVNGVEDPIEKAKIVYNFMQNKTRYISVQVGIGGWQPIAANVVDEVGYGDCKGLTNYTKALLDVVGVTSYFTLVYAQDRRDIDKDFASFQGNHAILNIPNNGNDIWLECTSQTAPFGFLGKFTDDRDVLVVTPEKGIIKHTSTYKNLDNLQVTNANIKLTEEGNLEADVNILSNGTQYDDKEYIDGLTDEELIKNYKSRIWSYNNNLEIPSFKITNDKEKVQFKEDLKVSIKNYASVNENEYLFRVNVFSKNSYVPKRYRNRELPLKINRGYKDEDSLTIKIPSSYKIDFLPENQVVSSEFGSYKINFKKIDEETFSYHRELIIKEGIHSKELYDDYRDFRKKIAKLENTRIAITKK